MLLESQLSPLFIIEMWWVLLFIVVLKKGSFALSKLTIWLRGPTLVKACFPPYVSILPCIFQDEFQEQKSLTGMIKSEHCSLNNFPRNPCDTLLLNLKKWMGTSSTNSFLLLFVSTFHSFHVVQNPLPSLFDHLLVSSNPLLSLHVYHLKTWITVAKYKMSFRKWLWSTKQTNMKHLFLKCWKNVKQMGKKRSVQVSKNVWKKLFGCFQRQFCDGMILFVWDFFLSFSSQNDAFGFNQACVNCHWMHCNVHWSTSFPWWWKCGIGQVHHLEIIQNHVLFLHCCCHNLVLPSHQTNTNDFRQINMVAKENHFIVFRLENTRQENIVKNNNTWMEQNRLFIDIMENHNSWHHICS